MRIRLPLLSFRTKVVLLAVVLVTAIQFMTLSAVLPKVRGWQQDSSEHDVERAGAFFDEYMSHRTELLTVAVRTVADDFPFRDAIVDGDVPTIESVLVNHAERLGLEGTPAAVFDLDGHRIAELAGGEALWPFTVAEYDQLDYRDFEASAFVSIGFVGGRPFHTVTVPITLGNAIGWVSFGLPIDGQFAHEIRELTGLQASIIGGRGVGTKQVHATTLDEAVREDALNDVLFDGPGAELNSNWITELRPYNAGNDELFVALQLPMMQVEEEYSALRNSLLGVAAVALLITIAAAVWLPRLVTRPVGRLVDAAQRMAEGIYNQPIAVTSNDEFGVLAQGFNAMQEAIASREQHIVHMAHHDSLSGLPTRENVVSEIRDAISNCHQLAVVNFVLHRFDELASSLGHRTADRVIQLVAGRLRDRLGEEQILGHLNHQEFVLVLPDADLMDAEDFVLELQGMLRSGIAVGNANISLQIRAGIALYPHDGFNAAELLRCAGIARGHASHHQGSFGVYESGQEEKSLELIRIVGDFPNALEKRELKLEYQPKVDCNTLELTGAEALVRWEHPKLGRISPDLFIEAIEQAGGISQLTRWVLEEAAATMAVWRSRGLAISMSVNISANDLIDDYLPRHLRHLSERYAIEPASMTLEVTESAIMHDVENSLAVAAEIRGLGFRISIDDFGTGHSALAQLKRLPVDELKIDRSFVLNIDDQRDEAVVRTAIELAHQFGLTAVAEGVETEACLNRLAQLGCEEAQGFYFSKSLGARDFAAWAERWAAGDGADIVSLVETGVRARRGR